MRMLVIEKEKQNAVRIREALRQIWCDVELWSEENPDFPEEWQGDYDAVIIGSGLPGLTDMEIVSRMRESKCRLPVLMVTGEGPEGRISRLNQGADYCLSEPFEEGELLAALKAVLRRNGGFTPERLNYGELSLDHGTFVLSGPGGFFQLGRREFEVMHTLMVNSDMVVSKEFLLSRAWGDHPEAVENNVEVYVSLLRKKLKELNAGVSIQTIRNLGYRLRAEEED